MNEFKTPCTPTWCPGCGDFGIWSAVKLAVQQMAWKPSDFVAVYGVGCHGHMINFLRSYAAETLHGRPIPFAEGLHLANHKLPVIIVAGDGDTFGEGTNHLVHAARRNMNVTMILHDNQVYGLTTGQTAPTSQKGFKSKSTPAGVIEEPVYPLSMALTAGATYVARGFAGDIPFTTQLIVEGMKHRGFSFIDIFQPCVTFNHVNTYQWFREHLYHLPPDYVPDNRLRAYEKAQEWQDRIPMGVFYKEEKPTYEDQVETLKDQTLLDSPYLKTDQLQQLFSAFI